MAKIASQYNISFVISTGDNFYEDGISSVSDTKFRKVFTEGYAQSSLQVPWYVALGNHDYDGSVEAQIQASTSHVDSRWQMPARYFTVSSPVPLSSGATPTFVFLDTNPFIQSYYTSPETPQMAEELKNQHYQDQVAWFEKTLQAEAAATQRNGGWIVVVGHHPVYARSTDKASTELQQYVLPLLVKYRAGCYFSGHVHDLEHLQHENLDFFISGAGSQLTLTSSPSLIWSKALNATASSPQLGHDAGTKFHAKIPGFVLVQMSTSSMTTIYFDYQGNNLYQTVTNNPYQA
eukprot:TRINITY_DN2480_c0_g1_i1.p1 TRINITY_DN2480_c0_g1~~TRINITY_DN2480_c0_g1_i1.p1  ORF type:complete len:291 (+),score=112.43 TRINITY_DN2480_c0_g1_i1:96-968(+)